MDAEAKAKKRAEIMAKVAAARAAQDKAAAEKAKAPDKSMYGTHQGITCDGCSVVPLVGYRWRCKNCKNHDLCDSCYEDFKGGKLNHANSRRNPVSMRCEDHEFFPLAEHGVFKPMSGAGHATKVGKKTKPNAPCPCGSGKKYKKCCMNKGK